MANQIVHPEGSYTIQQVGPSREWDFKGDNGGNIAMKTYSIQLEGIADWVDLNQKADSDAPTVGEVIEGHVEDAGKYGFKFQKKRKGGSWSGGGKGYSAGAAWSAAYETATAIATGYYQVSGTKPKNPDDFMDKIDQLAKVVKARVDALAGAKEETKDDTDTEGGESPVENKAVVADGDVDKDSLGKW